MFWSIIHEKDGNTDTGLLFPAHANCSAEKVFLLFLGEKISPSTALTKLASKGNLCQQGLHLKVFYIQIKLLCTNQRQYTDKYIFNEQTTFFKSM